MHFVFAREGNWKANNCWKAAIVLLRYVQLLINWMERASVGHHLMQAPSFTPAEAQEWARFGTLLINMLIISHGLKWGQKEVLKTCCWYLLVLNDVNFGRVHSQTRKGRHTYKYEACCPVGAGMGWVSFTSSQIKISLQEKCVYTLTSASTFNILTVCSWPCPTSPRILVLNLDIC